MTATTIYLDYTKKLTRALEAVMNDLNREMKEKYSDNRIINIIEGVADRNLSHIIEEFSVDVDKSTEYGFRKFYLYVNLAHNLDPLTVTISMSETRVNMLPWWNGGTK